MKKLVLFLITLLGMQQSVSCMKLNDGQTPSKIRKIVETPFNKLPFEIVFIILQYAVFDKDVFPNLACTNQNMCRMVWKFRGCYLHGLDGNNNPRNLSNIPKSLKEQLSVASQPVLVILFTTIDTGKDQLLILGENYNKLHHLIPAYAIICDVKGKNSAKAKKLWNKIKEALCEDFRQSAPTENGQPPQELTNKEKEKITVSDNLKMEDIIHLTMIAAKHNAPGTILWLKNNYKEILLPEELPLDKSTDEFRNYDFFGLTDAFCDATKNALAEGEWRFSRTCLDKILLENCNHHNYLKMLYYYEGRSFLEKIDTLVEFTDPACQSDDEKNKMAIAKVMLKKCSYALGGWTLSRLLVCYLQNGNVQGALNCDRAQNGSCIVDKISCKDVFHILVARVKADDINTIHYTLKRFNEWLFCCALHSYYGHCYDCCGSSSPVILQVIEQACQLGCKQETIDALLNDKHVDNMRLLQLAFDSESKETIHLLSLKTGLGFYPLFPQQNNQQ